MSHFKTYHKALVFSFSIYVIQMFYLPYGLAEDLKGFEKGSYLAQYQDSGDSYDPFADYSEFDSVTEEEADINFFRHGRLISLGALGGARVFTQKLYQETRPAFVGGFYFSFFFNLKFAVQINYLVGIHALRIASLQGNTQTLYTSQMSLIQLGFDLKYYLNTQNVTQGLAIINPYLILGPDVLWQEVRLRGEREGTLTPDANIFGFHGGLGIEFPFTRNKMFFGIEVQYQFVQLPRLPYDRTNSGNGSEEGIPNQGDILKGLGIIGVNF